MKCQVRLCPNTSEEGRFDGNLCAPCAEALKGSDGLLSPAARRILASLIPAFGEIVDGRAGR